MNDPFGNQKRFRYERFRETFALDPDLSHYDVSTVVLGLLTEVDRLREEMQTKIGVCVWETDEDGVSESGCGNAFVFESDGPVANGCKFCMYCGHLLVVSKGADDGTD